jgi:hypothetical protein
MLKLNRASVLLAMLHRSRSGVASGGQIRTMRVYSKMFSHHAVSESKARVLKVAPVAFVNFVTCLDWAVFYSQSTVGRATGAGKDAF